MSEKFILTPYGDFREEAFEQLQFCFDTHQILVAVDAVDGFYKRWTETLKASLMRLNAMADTVANCTPAIQPLGEENLPELASSLSAELDEVWETLCGVVKLLDRFSDLAPD